MSALLAPSRERDRFVQDLLGYMSLEEKLGQLDLARTPDDPSLEAAIAVGRVGGVVGVSGLAAQRLQELATRRSRLGIPLLLTGAAPVPPCSPWALAATWDEDLVEAVGNAFADASLRCQVNCVPAPRVTFGDPVSSVEAPHLATSDPCLGARLAAALAAGIAGREQEPPARVLPMLSCDPGPAAAPFELAARAMAAPAVAAIDCPALDHDVTPLASFDGILLAECRRIQAIVAAHFATTGTRSPLEAAERAIAEGLLSERVVDAAVTGVLAVKHALGLFRAPERNLADRAILAPPPGPAEIARKAMVLLRNESGLLPFSPVSDRVLLVGPPDGAGMACAEAVEHAGIGFSSAPGLALRRDGESWHDPVPGDHFALALTRNAAQRCDFILLALDDRHFAPTEDSRWDQPTPAVVAMVRALSGLGARLIAVIATAEPVDLGPADQHFATILQCWTPGAGFGEALGDVLAGRHSPSGRLPIAAGRHPFGHGLSFGEGVFSSFAISARANHVAASVRVRNAGHFAARETVQLYTRLPGGAARLASFAHVTLAPGEDAPVSFELGVEELGRPGDHGRLEVAPGVHEILIGKSAARLAAGEVHISGELARAISTGRPRLRAVG